ncbi:methyl-accepting chemotaxis protein [Vibrio sp. JC009]|uniref:methyl-accepting chemotaxis protein n=1 Tax=Vibrio sp. JC009 TaxID=2912314 RepID=UPI0023AF2AA1|nr:methyl-accepting chemotaxis protein [Vibrio sp. JC009]WED23752.1 methyl-accepting chemotaxis protein [Vibrio sp. JC009]
MKLNSVKAKLWLMVATSVVALAILGFSSVKGLKRASQSIEVLHRQGMTVSNRATEVIQHIGDARSSLLLAFQHDPASKFASMHNHQVSLHLDDVTRRLNKVEDTVRHEILTSELSGEQRIQVEAFLKHFEKIRTLGFNPAINEINKGNYLNANQLLLTVINPRYVELEEEAVAFLKSKTDEGNMVYQQAEKYLLKFEIVMMAMSIGFASVLCLLAILIIRRLSRALNDIHNTATDISGGDLTKKVNLSGNDELAAISGFVDEIADSFRSVICGMNDRTGQLSSSAEQSSAIAEQTKQNIVEQQQQTQMVATAINEFSSTVQDVSNSAASAAGASETAEKATSEGMSIVEQTIDKITQLDGEIHSATQLIQELSEQSTEIGTVVDVIEGISEQTNLLALNAAIEAARAGEAGRGFAVVADEVRSLASRTQQSTEEIKSMISKLQDSSKNSLSKMELGAEDAKATVDMAQQAGIALNEITQSVSVINSLNIQIAAAAEQQSVVTEEISQNINSINDISTETAAGAEQSSIATLELAQIADGMKKDVAQFCF